MSYRAIAAALALEGVSVGERLVAYSLASYAGRDHRAWPAARTAALRAGLSRRQYLAARTVLVERGALVVEAAAGRSGGQSLVRLRFAEAGPSIEREINAGLFEAVLARARVRGGTRVLLATLAALADESGSVEGLTAEEICEASGLSDRTYRRARSELLDVGEITLEAAGGGRSRRNRWRVRDPSNTVCEDRRAAPPRLSSTPSQSPLTEAGRDVRPKEQSGAGAKATATTPGVSETVARGSANPGRNPGVNPGQTRTPRSTETPAQTPAETPAPRARPGREPQNLRITPPDPPAGGHADTVSVVEEYVSDRGRRRRRLAVVDPSEISDPTERDHADWLSIRDALRGALGDGIFEVWFAAYMLQAVSTCDDALLIHGPTQTDTWVRGRYGPLLDSLAERAGRRLRVASDRELSLLRCRADSAPPPANSVPPSGRSVSLDHKEVV